MRREMKYADVPPGCEWQYPDAREGIYLKLANGDSMSSEGNIFARHPNEMVILIGYPDRRKTCIVK